MTLTDSIVEDGPVFILDAHNVTLSRLHLRILDCVLERRAGSGPGSAVQINGQNGADPTDVLLSGVRVAQASAGVPVRTERLARLTVVGSEVTYSGPATTDPAIVVRGFDDAPAEAAVVVDSRFVGPLGDPVGMRGVFRGDPVLVRVTRG